MKIQLIATLLLVGSLHANATTLQRLSVAEMTDQATAIVRAKVHSCAAAFRGSLIYTTCTLSVIERWKGAPANTVAISIPGGTVGTQRQTFSGTPTLNPGDEQIFFLWTGRSGITQVMGLSQGVLTLEKTANGQVYATRTPTSERMLDHTGRPVADEGVDVLLEDFKSSVLSRIELKAKQ
ncbi:MAG: hypothetical protein NTZ56_17580 [Acidobacteria bacterium]|nr:hypothetical protein [Acidobacteriota bacterium]